MTASRIARLGILATLAAVAYPATAQQPPTAPAPTAGQPGAPGEQPPETAPAPAPPPTAAPLGGVGESCRARGDCQAGLKCVNQTCRDEAEGTSCTSRADCGPNLKCVNNVCTSGPLPGAGPGAPGAAPGWGAEAAPEDTGPKWSEFEIKGTHGFAGLVVTPGFGVGMTLGSGALSDPAAALNFALKGGVLLDQLELALELSPATFFWDLSAGVNAFQFNGSVGYLIQVIPNLYWPIRVGVGMALETKTDTAFLEARGDFVGLMYQYGHLAVDFHLPTFRFLTDADNAAAFAWLFGVGGEYIF